MMNSNVKCSYDNCSNPSWVPRGLLLSKQKPFCIFHSPLLNRKRAQFVSEWDTYLAKARIVDHSFNSLLCRGFIFPIDIDFSGAIFTEEGDFSGAIFTGAVNFCAGSHRPGRFYRRAFFGISGFR